MSSDPLVSLASSIHAGPGVYALLLGSGVSRAAGIPTGWEITLDLIARLADVRGDDAEADPETWYRSRFESAPEYSFIVEQLAQSPDDRQRLLSRYIEPSELEREQGLKVPTTAHRGIARLVADGYVKVIITTNFDRLLETAIKEAGVEPRVIASDDHARGATPLVHSGCTVIKVHGDYLWSDLKNTADELNRYGTAMRRLLREVFDQYGLVVCGWSAEWDAALRKVLVRSPTRRFTTYWLHRSPVTPEADNLIDHRRAIKAEITDADTAFDALAERVSALGRLADRAPQDTRVALMLLKRYLPDPIRHIDLHDLVNGETERVIEDISRLTPEANGAPERFVTHLRAYEQSCARLLSLLATGVYFSNRDDHDELWNRSMQRLALQTTPTPAVFSEALKALDQYPSLLALYAISIGAISARRIEPLAGILGSIEVPLMGSSFPLAVAVSLPFVFPRPDITRTAMPTLMGRRAPESEHLFHLLRPAIAEIVPDEHRYKTVFNEAEYLLGLVYDAQTSWGGAPIGRIANGRLLQSDLPSGAIDRHADLLIEARIFESHDHIENLRGNYDSEIRQFSRRPLGSPQ